MKKISILITSYNLEDYIDKAIQSVVSQEMPCEWELLIGDDGSTDRTISIINDWIAKYPDNIRLYSIARNENHGMDGFRAAKNRAFLLEKANGDYINYLDGDDCWLGSEKLKRQFDLLESQEYQDTSCCAHNIYKYFVSDGKGANMVSESIPMRTYTAEEYWAKGYFHTNTILFRSTCKDILLDPINRGYLNDIFITYCLLQKGKLLYVPESWAQYNITGTGLWTGQKIIYGRFRNMHLYDLELRINPSLAKQSFVKHWGDIKYIMENYTQADVDLIAPLVKNLDASIFVYTLLLSKLDNLSKGEKRMKRNLWLKGLILRIKQRLKLI